MQNEIWLSAFGPKVRKQIEKLPNVTAIRFDLAYGVTPALFVTYQRDGDTMTERVRIMSEDDVLKWHKQVYETAMARYAKD